MYKKIIVAFDESPEARRAPTNAIEFAKQLGAELRIVTVTEPLPVYAGFIDSEVPGARQGIAAGTQMPSTASCRNRP